MILHSMREMCKKMFNFFVRLACNLRSDCVIEYGTDLRYAKLGTYTFVGKRCCVFRSEMGKCSYIGDNTYLPYTKIGNFCSIGSMVYLASGMHPATFISTHPATYSAGFLFKDCQVLNKENVTYKEYAYTDESNTFYCEIGNDVWIATDVLLVCGKHALRIGDGAIIRAGSVVTKDVPPYAIVQGHLATIIGFRFNAQEIEQLQAMKWWDRDMDWLKAHATLFSKPADFFETILEETVGDKKAKE